MDKYDYIELGVAARLFVIGEKQKPIKNGIKCTSYMVPGDLFGYRFSINPKADMLARFEMYPTESIIFDDEFNQKIWHEYKVDWKSVLRLEYSKQNYSNNIDRTLTSIGVNGKDFYVDIYSNVDLSITENYLVGRMDMFGIRRENATN